MMCVLYNFYKMYYKSLEFCSILLLLAYAIYKSIQSIGCPQQDEAASESSSSIKQRENS